MLCCLHRELKCYILPGQPALHGRENESSLYSSDVESFASKSLYTSHKCGVSATPLPRVARTPIFNLQPVLAVSSNHATTKTRHATHVPQCHLPSDIQHPLPHRHRIHDERTLYIFPICIPLLPRGTRRKNKCEDRRQRGILEEVSNNVRYKIWAHRTGYLRYCPLPFPLHSARLSSCVPAPHER
jgi:hypothetical protein